MSTKYEKKTYIKLEFLREGATQSGVAYPKFYLWVAVYDSILKNELGQGAIRVAAIEKKHFQITDYLTKEEIIKIPDSIYQVFPKPVCEKIIAKLR
jgi:hypothetical protein